MSDQAGKDRAAVRLDTFDNTWFNPGRPFLIRVAWMVCNAAFMLTWVPWPSAMKCWLLRTFGGRVGRGVVLKPRINVKYPWNLEVGDHAWLGEGVWLDSLAPIRIGSHACLSQGCVIETGNHDWSKPTFDLVTKPVTVDVGAWAAVGSLLLPGSHLANHAVLGAGSVLSGQTEPYGIYVGVPAVRVRERQIRDRE